MAVRRRRHGVSLALTCALMSAFLFSGIVRSSGLFLGETSDARQPAELGTTRTRAQQLPHRRPTHPHNAVRRHAEYIIHGSNPQFWNAAHHDRGFLYAASMAANFFLSLSQPAQRAIAGSIVDVRSMYNFFSFGIQLRPRGGGATSYGTRFTTGW